MTDKTTQSVETASSGTNPESGEPATSMWAKGLLPFGRRGKQGPTDPHLTMTCFEQDWSGWDPTGTPQLRLLKFGTRSYLVALASRVIRTSGAPLLLTFHGSAWHLRIATASVTLPGHWAIEPSGLEQPTTCVVMQAKLYAQPPVNLGQLESSNASNVWRAVALKDSDVEISSFLYTALQRAEKPTNE